MAEKRIDHARGALRGFLEEFEAGSPGAVEAIGNWYWITDKIEAAGMTPQVHASRGHARLGRTRPDVDHSLRWAYAEAANTSMVHRRRGATSG
ncbi:MAG: hypothetical protein PHU43_11270 [Candidatus Bipolaricaulis sp.]|nr:hypothetical protein [Candidatus Bipolaricaulis sp.]MDD5265398.1 hypothetical protein [Candidatus Bipolaricaulis sp.]